MTSAQPDFTFTYRAAQRERFRTGTLAETWRERYPELFDTEDLKLLNTPHQRTYHFFEWLSAILLYEATGYRSLVEGYTAKTHPDKRRQLERVVGPEIFQELDKRQSGQPDLFVYRMETKSWFFCEVKGPGDRMRKNQKEWIEYFSGYLQGRGITGKRTRELRLREIDFD